MNKIIFGLQVFGLLAILPLCIMLQLNRPASQLEAKQRMSKPTSLHFHGAISSSAEKGSVCIEQKNQKQAPAVFTN